MIFRVLLIFLVALAVLWRWRITRSRSQQTIKRKTTAQNATQAMIPCTHCGVHTPADSVVAGQEGSYCSADHLHAEEG